MINFTTASADTEVRVIRETCIRCGLCANLDPALHASRYGHRPVVVRAGKRLEFEFTTYAFTKEVS